MSARERTLERPSAARPSARSAASHATPAALLNVGPALGAAGQPLDRATRDLMEPRFGHDFSRVRVHTEPAAAESARGLNARAYTVGSHVVFGSGQFAPGTSRGLRLLAHELSHVVQQRAVPAFRPLSGALLEPEGAALETAAERQTDLVAASRPSAPLAQGPPLTHPRIQRSGIGSFFSDFFSLSPGPITAVARLFGSEKYSDKELLDYLTKIATDKKIEGNYDSDNKARAVVKRWMAKTKGFDPKPEVKILLIREMQSGYTSGDDERGILTILHNSPYSELEQIFGAGGIDPKNLDSDFSGANQKELRAFYDKIFEGGTKAVLAGSRELTRHVKAPYAWADFKKLLDQRFTRIESSVNSAAEADRDQAGADAARLGSGEVYTELNSLVPAEREQALQDLAGERTRQDTVLSDVNFKQTDSKSDAAAIEALKKKGVALEAFLLMLDLILQSIAKDVAVAAPKDAKAFHKTTKPLTAAQKKAAQAALKPLTREQVVAEVTGAAPPVAKFVQTLPGEKITYDDKIRARAPKVIDEAWDRFGKPRSEAVHKDPDKTHKLSELETIANASKDETDLVFGSFKKADAFTADKFNKKGILIKSGNIHDAWLSEQAKFKADPGYQAASAEFWAFYLIENDNDSKDPDTIQQIEYRHNASPQLDENRKPLNPEAKVIAEVGNKLAKSDAKRLFEVGRGWDAFNIKGGVSVQLFKDPDETRDRAFLWDMFYTLIHEYLHTLASGPYNTFADHLGGEHTDAGNTLIEGVDSLLTETVWTNARPHASSAKIRAAVEPDAVKAGKPYDDSLVPQTPWRRYDSYPRAVKLASVVGIRNLYDAYFNGNVKAIGG